MVIHTRLNQGCTPISSLLLNPSFKNSFSLSCTKPFSRTWLKLSSSFNSLSLSQNPFLFSSLLLSEFSRLVLTWKTCLGFFDALDSRMGSQFILGEKETPEPSHPLSMCPFIIITTYSSKSLQAGLASKEHDKKYIILSNTKPKDVYTSFLFIEAIHVASKSSPSKKHKIEKKAISLSKKGNLLAGLLVLF